LSERRLRKCLWRVPAADLGLPSRPDRQRQLLRAPHDGNLVSRRHKGRRSWRLRADRHSVRMRTERGESRGTLRHVRTATAVPAAGRRRNAARDHASATGDHPPGSTSATCPATNRKGASRVHAAAGQSADHQPRPGRRCVGLPGESGAMRGSSHERATDRRGDASAAGHAALRGPSTRSPAGALRDGPWRWRLEPVLPKSWWTITKPGAGSASVPDGRPTGDALHARRARAGGRTRRSKTVHSLIAER
jgi:hypothetical protein